VRSSRAACADVGPLLAGRPAGRRARVTGPADAPARECASPRSGPAGDVRPAQQPRGRGRVGWGHSTARQRASTLVSSGSAGGTERPMSSPSRAKRGGANQARSPGDAPRDRTCATRASGTLSTGTTLRAHARPSVYRCAAERAGSRRRTARRRHFPRAQPSACRCCTRGTAARTSRRGCAVSPPAAPALAGATCTANAGDPSVLAPRALAAMCEPGAQPRGAALRTLLSLPLGPSADTRACTPGSLRCGPRVARRPSRAPRSLQLRPGLRLPRSGLRG
jgi:hypothetical protein